MEALGGSLWLSSMGQMLGAEYFESAYQNTPNCEVMGAVALTRYRCRCLLSSDFPCHQLIFVGVGDRRILLSLYGADGLAYWWSKLELLSLLAVQRNLLPNDRMVVSAQDIVISRIIWIGHSYGA